MGKPEVLVQKIREQFNLLMQFRGRKGVWRFVGLCLLSMILRQLRLSWIVTWGEPPRDVSLTYLTGTGVMKNKHPDFSTLQAKLRLRAQSQAANGVLLPKIRKERILKNGTKPILYLIAG